MKHKHCHCFTCSWTKHISTGVLFLIALVCLSHIVLYKDQVIKSVTRTTKPYFSFVGNFKQNNPDSFHRLGEKRSYSSEASQNNVRFSQNTEVDHLFRTDSSDEDLTNKDKKRMRIQAIETIEKQGNSTISRPGKKVANVRNLQSSNSDKGISSEVKTFNKISLDASVVKLKESFLKKLLRDLNFKIERMLPLEKMRITKTCQSDLIVGNSCSEKGCLRRELPAFLHTRIEQLVTPAVLHTAATYQKTIENMGNAVSEFHDIIIVTGASSNHYLESKALLQNLKDNVFPHLRNFTFIYYNLGLTVEQKEDISSVCQCSVIDFPFDQFPSHISILKCYSWKPIIVNAHIPHCNVLLWVDASIRFRANPSYFKELLRRVRVRGFQAGTNKNLIPHVTLREMFHFFGDEACAYLPYTETMSGFTLFLNERLVRWTILEPWTACALNESCMCLHQVKDPKTARISCLKRTGYYEYGWCHRFDQSALGIIVRKLFQDKSQHLFIPDIRGFLDIKRGDKWNETIHDDEG